MQRRDRSRTRRTYAVVPVLTMETGYSLGLSLKLLLNRPEKATSVQVGRLSSRQKKRSAGELWIHRDHGMAVGRTIREAGVVSRVE